MMPKLPPLPEFPFTVWDYENSTAFEAAKQSHEAYARTYGRAVAKACAVICDNISDAAHARYKGRLPEQERGTSYSPHDEGRSDGAGECATAIREAAKGIGKP